MSEKETINSKIKRLDDSIHWFYSEDFSLESAAEHYRSAKSLAKEIESDLDELKNEITILSEDFTK